MNEKKLVATLLMFNEKLRCARKYVPIDQKDRDGSGDEEGSEESESE